MAYHSGLVENASVARSTRPAAAPSALFAAPVYRYYGDIGDCDAECAGIGAFYGCGCLLGVTMAALVAEIAWVGSMSFIMFFTLSKTKMLRVSAEVEEAGMDVSKHGGAAYEGGDLPAQKASTTS